MSANHPAGSRLHYCQLCATGTRAKQLLRPCGVDNAVMACPTCDPNLFDQTLSRKEPT